MKKDNIIINKKKIIMIFFIIIILLLISLIIISILFNKFNNEIKSLKSSEQENIDTQLVCYKSFENGDLAVIISSFKNDSLLDIRSIYTLNYNNNNNNYSLKFEDFSKYVDDCKNDLANNKVLECDVYDNDNSIRLYNKYKGNGSNIESNILDYTEANMICQQYNIN